MSELERIFLTSGLTIFAGVLVLVLGQLVQGRPLVLRQEDLQTCPKLMTLAGKPWTLGTGGGEIWSDACGSGRLVS